jgi:hypothetical protein
MRSELTRKLTEAEQEMSPKVLAYLREVQQELRSEDVFQAWMLISSMSSFVDMDEASAVQLNERIMRVLVGETAQHNPLRVSYHQKTVGLFNLVREVVQTRPEQDVSETNFFNWLIASILFYAHQESK